MSTSMKASAQERDAARNPVRVGLDGADGLQIGMTVDDARSRLSDRLPILITGGGSSRELYLPICGGRTAGVAEFGAAGNADGTYTYLNGDGFLLSVYFSAGAVSRAGVGIGSTRAEVVRAYGSKLQSDSFGNLLLIGTPHRFAGRTASPAVVFEFNGSRVGMLGYGTKSSLEYPSTDTSSC